MRVAAVPQQWVGQAGAMPPPAVVDAKNDVRQAWGPLEQELVAHALQIAHHELQDAPVGQVLHQERMHILLLCPNRENNLSKPTGPPGPSVSSLWKRTACVQPPPLNLGENKVTEVLMPGYQGSMLAPTLGSGEQPSPSPHV